MEAATSPTSANPLRRDLLVEHPLLTLSCQAPRQDKALSAGAVLKELMVEFWIWNDFSLSTQLTSSRRLLMVGPTRRIWAQPQ